MVGHEDKKVVFGELWLAPLAYCEEGTFEKVPVPFLLKLVIIWHAFLIDNALVIFGSHHIGIIRAARELESDVHCNLTLLFGFGQSPAPKQASRLSDILGYYKKTRQAL
ncbi:hypothetical protein SCLCIDRAFT_28473 [Scleroderma citrinum Foug A]|uniref:Uncharacterized protein n=1 Tax=Scleroderma citrinum Foug A TaxID=1036808 RepID=A0A0C2Z7J7_9AGAM|nr:hypothetical protein SCLCIDRAFT_28473 [Scleroderma citrinum Foug A]